MIYCKICHFGSIRGTLRAPGKHNLSRDDNLIVHRGERPTGHRLIRQGRDQVVFMATKGGSVEISKQTP